jgi:hypothetical protein
MSGGSVDLALLGFAAPLIPWLAQSEALRFTAIRNSRGAADPDVWGLRCPEGACKGKRCNGLELRLRRIADVQKQHLRQPARGRVALKRGLWQALLFISVLFSPNLGASRFDPFSVRPGLGAEERRPGDQPPSPEKPWQQVQLSLRASSRNQMPHKGHLPLPLCHRPEKRNRGQTALHQKAMRSELPRSEFEASSYPDYPPPSFRRIISLPVAGAERSSAVYSNQKLEEPQSFALRQPRETVARYGNHFLGPRFGRFRDAGRRVRWAVTNL